MNPKQDEMTTEQRLLMFVSSGERGGLTLTEGALLRLGIRQMAEQLEQAARTAGGRENRIRELEHKLAAAERDLLRTEPYQVPCPHCHAEVGQRCRPAIGGAPPSTPHTARLNNTRKDTP